MKSMAFQSKKSVSNSKSYKKSAMKKLPSIMNLILCFLSLSGCAVNRSVLTTSEKVTVKKVFEVLSPGPDWKRKEVKSVHSEKNSATIRDIIYSKCPGPKIVVISRAVYRPPLFGRKKVNLDSFEGVALAYLDEVYKGLRHIRNRELISHQSISVAGSSAVEAMYKTSEPFTDCDGDKRETEILNKFIIIEGGDAAAFWSWGLKSPKMMVLWYASPVENFDDGVGDFDRMVQSFRFLSN